MHHTADGGDITVTNGIVILDDGLETAVYLALFGGNQEDDGTTSTAVYQWWGTVDEPDPARQYRGELQALLLRLPATTGNLALVEGAAKRDVDRVLGAIADDIAVSVALTGVRRIDITVNVTIDAAQHTFTFTSDWEGP